MNRDFLRKIRAIVSQELTSLANGNGLRPSDEALSPQAGADPLDQAQAQTEQNLNLRFSDRKNRYVLKLKEALNRLDLGVFGVCEECEGEIPVKRLLARPTTIHCVTCKNELEGLERTGFRARMPMFSPS